MNDNINAQSGCETLHELWRIAVKNTAVANPGASGWSARIFSPIESENILWSMQMATMKCWEERSKNSQPIGFPPVILENKIYRDNNVQSDSNKEKGKTV